jgi:hypothetical protein
MGNTPAVGDKTAVYLYRLLLDRDTPAKPLLASVQEESN